MSRKILKILCIASGVLLVLFSVLTVFFVKAGMERVSANGGIIGGAGAPTVEFLLRTSWSFYAAQVALLLFAGTGLALIFSKKK